MPADVVNLRTARKAKARREKEQAAAETRRRFGRTKSEKASDEAARLRAAQQLDQHHREPETDER